MGENPNSDKKRALTIFMLVFLCLGGGAFIFLVFRGLGDLKGGTKANFSYGFNTRSAAVPVFEYFGLAENEEADADQVEAAKTRIEARGLETSLLDEPQADISDWMSKGGEEKSGNASVSFPAPPAKTYIPQMSGLSGPAGGGGGGSSRSSADISRFGSGADSGSAKISKTGQSGPESGKGKAALNALGNARAALGEGTRADSAMAARSKWDRGFGLSVNRNNGGSLSYGKSGLVKLDHIKSGEISDLKGMGSGSIKVADPGSPSMASGSGSGASAAPVPNPLANSMNSMMGSMMGMMGMSGMYGGRGSQTPGGDAAPPKEVSALAEKPNAEGGNYCPGGCSCGPDCTFKDNEPSYAKNPDGSWSVAYSGEQTGADGQTVYYKDVCKLAPGGDNPATLVLVSEGRTPGEMTYIWK